MPRNRIYQFQLPYDVGTLGIVMLRSKIHSSGAFERLPAVLQQKLESGQTVITKQDLDMLPDDVWSSIAETAGLQWHPAPSHRDEDDEYEQVGPEIGAPPPAKPPVHHPDPKAVEQKRADTKKGVQEVKAAKKAQPVPLSKGASSNSNPGPKASHTLKSDNKNG